MRKLLGAVAPASAALAGCSDAGAVPGTNAPYTYILYPQDCATDLPGVTP